MTRDRLEQIANGLKERFPDVISVYRFGSSGTSNERSGSDLDLAVYAGTPLPVVDLWHAAQEIAAEIGRDVDLVDLAAASTVMRAEVIHTGERLYCADEFACETFEDYAYSSYARLNEERREILQDILERGNVYG